MRLNNIHVSSKEPVNPSLWVDTSGKNPILKGYVNGQYVILSEDVPDNVITKDMIVDSLESDATDVPLSAAQGKALKELINSIDVSEDIKEAINALDSSGQTASTGEVISSVSQENGVLSVSKKTLTSDDIPKLPQSKITDLSTNLAAKQDILTAGTGIEITPENRINVTLDTTVFKVVSALPESPAAGDENKIFLVPAESTEEGNIYTEYVYVNGKWEEFGTYKSEVDLTPYLKKTDAESTYQKITDNTLATTAKTVVGAINENTGNVTRIDRAVGNPVIEEVDLNTPDESNFYWSIQGTKSSSTAYGIKFTSLSKGDLLIANVGGTTNVQIITILDSTHSKRILDTDVNGYVQGDTPQMKYAYMATEDCIAAISYTVSMDKEAYIIKSPFNTAISDNSYMQYLHKVYEEYGAVYNKETGYWEYGDLKDMTEEDCFLAAFYALEQIQGDSNLSYIFDRYINTKARTYFTRINPKGGYQGTRLYLPACFAQNSKLEYLKLSTESTSPYLYINSMFNAFRSCHKLRKIEDVLSINQVNDMTGTFIECASLRDVKIRLMSNGNNDISFKDSPLLSYESLNYLITNAANTAAITVTVHPTTYSYLTGTAQPTEEVGGTTEEWQALVTTAQGKQISFAQPAETLEVEPLE